MRSDGQNSFGCAGVYSLLWLCVGLSGDHYMLPHDPV